MWGPCSVNFVWPPASQSQNHNKGHTFTHKLEFLPGFQILIWICLLLDLIRNIEAQLFVHVWGPLYRACTNVPWSASDYSRLSKTSLQGPLKRINKIKGRNVEMIVWKGEFSVFWWKVVSDGADVMSADSLFQTLGPATGKAWVQIDESRHTFVNLFEIRINVATTWTKSVNSVIFVMVILFCCSFTSRQHI